MVSDQKALFVLFVTRFEQCFISPEIIFITSQEMSDIRMAEGELRTTAECDAEIQKIESRINEIRAIPQQSNHPLEREVLLELEAFVRLLERCRDVIKEIKDSMRTQEGSGAGHEVTLYRGKNGAPSDTNNACEKDGQYPLENISSRSNIRKAFEKPST